MRAEIKKEFFDLWYQIFDKMNESDETDHAYSLPFYLDKKVDELNKFKFNNYQGNFVQTHVNLMSLASILIPEHIKTKEQFIESRKIFIKNIWNLISIAQNDDVRITKI